MAAHPHLYVQYGCGLSCPQGWINFDNSPTLRLQKIPGFGRIVRGPRFPLGVRIGDIVKGLPVDDGSVSGAYASHVLEHLSRSDFVLALRNTFRMLAPGGIFRLIVPDLEARIKLYLEQEGNPNANDALMRMCFLGRERRLTGLSGVLREAFGNSTHLWMWDEKAMHAALSKEGFIEVRRCRFNDCSDPAFRVVEDKSRFQDPELGFDECAMEAVKPRQ